MKFTCTLPPFSDKAESNNFVKALKRSDGVGKVKLNAVTGVLKVTFDEDFTGAEELTAQIAALGYTPLPEKTKEKPAREPKEKKEKTEREPKEKKAKAEREPKEKQDGSLRFRDVLAFLLCCFTVYLSLGQKHLLPARGALSYSVSAAITQMVIMALVWLLIGRAAFSGLKKRGVGMFTLTALGAFAAALYSIPALILGAYSLHLENAGEIRVFFDSAALIPLLIRLGQMFESRMRRRAETVPGTLDDSDTAPMISRLVKLTRIASVLMLLLALAAGVIWLLRGKGLPYSVNTLVTVLVVVCPGALELAVPAAFMKGLRRCAEDGVSVKSTGRFEALGRTNIVLLHRRSTLCMDEAAVCGTTLASGAGEDQLISIAASAMTGMISGEAKAVCELAKEKNLPLDPLNAIEEDTPAGRRALIGDTNVAVGSIEYMRACTFDMEPWEELTQAETEKGRSCLFVASHGTVLGFITLCDRLRPGAKEAVARLKDMGIEVGLLVPERTSADEAAAVNADIGTIITHEDSEISLRLMKADKKHVVGVYDGDECPDEPLLKGFMNFSLGAVKDAAPDAESAEEDLLALPDSITCAKKTISRCRRCLRVWIIYNLIAIAVAGGALYKILVPVSPVLACACMLIIDIVIVLIAVTAKRKKNKNAN